MRDYPDDLHPDLAALLGTVVHDHYRIEELLGRGGMGAVFKGRHTTIDRSVAIKVILPETDESAGASERFVQEARSISRLDHRNCVRLLDFYQDEAGRKYLFMEFLRGTELSRRLGEPWSPSEFVRLARQILEGIEHAHHFGLVHRDIKPENLFITTDHHGNEIVKIIDFGLAKILNSSDPYKRITRTGQIFGTPEYMSPEQAAGDATDQRTDLYALGIVFYEMLTGARPYNSDNIVALMRMHVMGSVPKLPASVPEPLAALVGKLLQKKPADRYPDAKAVIAELDALSPRLAELEGRHFFQKASNCLTKGDKQQALLLFERAARFGDADAMSELGHLYGHRSRAESDQELAFKWYAKAAQLGNVEASYQVGLRLVDGSGVAQNAVRGCKFLRKAAERGHAPAMYKLACCHRFGTGIKNDWVAAFEWCQKAAAAGHVEAMYDLGRHYSAELPGTQSDSAQALTWYRAAADVGSVAAKLHVGQHYEQIDKNPQEALEWYRIAARAGSVDAMFRVGRYLEEGLSSAGVDQRQSLIWYQEAAGHGHSESMYRLGRYHQQGGPVERNLHEGFKWYLAAAEKGFSAAMLAVASCYEVGTGVARDADSARYWHRRSAEAGNLESVEVLAEHHQLEMERWQALLPRAPARKRLPASLLVSGSLNLVLLLVAVCAAVGGLEPRAGIEGVARAEPAGDPAPQRAEAARSLAEPPAVEPEAPLVETREPSAVEAPSSEPDPEPEPEPEPEPVPEPVSAPEPKSASKKVRLAEAPTKAEVALALGQTGWQQACAAHEGPKCHFWIAIRSTGKISSVQHVASDFKSLETPSPRCSCIASTVAQEFSVPRFEKPVHNVPRTL